MGRPACPPAAYVGPGRFLNRRAGFTALVTESGFPEDPREAFDAVAFARTVSPWQTWIDEQGWIGGDATLALPFVPAATRACFDQSRAQVISSRPARSRLVPAVEISPRA